MVDLFVHRKTLVILDESHNFNDIKCHLKALGSESIPLFTDSVIESFKGMYGTDLDILKARLGMVTFVIEKHELGLVKPEMYTINIKSLYVRKGQSGDAPVCRGAHGLLPDRSAYEAGLEYYEAEIRHQSTAQIEYRQYQENIRIVQPVH